MFFYLYCKAGRLNTVCNNFAGFFYLSNIYILGLNLLHCFIVFTCYDDNFVF